MELNKEARNNLHISGQSVFDKNVKVIQWRNDILFNRWS